MKGFALILTLLFLLLFTLFGFSLLMLAESHYASTRNLFENENARITCEAAAWQLVARHNLSNENPRFFFDSKNWTGQTMKSLLWNGYRIAGSLQAPWSASGSNLFSLSARKGTFFAEQQLEIRQRRLEDFALFAEANHILTVAPLFDGLVFVRGSVELKKPTVRFREIVQANVFPETYASYREKTLQEFNYPEMERYLSASLFLENATRNGIVILRRNPLFWVGDHYRLDLDQVQVTQQARGWSVRYKGSDLGTFVSLHFWFDDELELTQSDGPLSFLPSTKQAAPLYLSSANDIRIRNNLRLLESSSAVHPLCLMASDAIYLLSTVPQACRLNACLIALGSDAAEDGEASFLILPGGSELSQTQKQTFLTEVQTSSFLLEVEKRTSLIQALEAGEKIVWLRGSVILRAPLSVSADLAQLHFEATRGTFPLLPSLPFVYLVEGGRQWR